MPHSPANGEVSISGMKTDAYLSYTCYPGYELKGVSSRRCLVSGNWSAEEPLCSRE